MRVFPRWNEYFLGMKEASRRLLIVEDERLLAELLCKSLISFGFEVETAPNASEARKKINTFDPDILLVDISLGDGPSGIHLAHAVHQTRPDIGILVLTKHKNAKSANAEGLELPPGVGFLRKHKITDISYLLEGIEKVLADKPNEVRQDEPEVNPIEGFSPQALKVLSLIAKGYNNSEIALQMNLSVKSVERWIEKIYSTLNVKSDKSINPRVEAARQYYLIAGISQRTFEK